MTCGLGKSRSHPSRVSERECKRSRASILHYLQPGARDGQEVISSWRDVHCMGGCGSKLCARSGLEWRSAGGTGAEQQLGRSRPAAQAICAGLAPIHRTAVYAPVQENGGIRSDYSCNSSPISGLAETPGEARPELVRERALAQIRVGGGVLGCLASVPGTGLA